LLKNLADLLRSHQYKWKAAKAIVEFRGFSIDHYESINFSVQKVFKFTSSSIHHVVALSITAGRIDEVEDGVKILLKVLADEEKFYLPPSLKISLLSESGEEQFSLIAEERDNYLQLGFIQPPDTGFLIRISLDQVSFTESFIT